MQDGDSLKLTALEALPDALVVTDGQSIIRYINLSARRLLGVITDTLQDAPLTDLPGGTSWRTPEQHEAFYEFLRTHLDWQASTPSVYEQTWLGKIDQRLLRFCSTPMYTAAQKLLGLIIRIEEYTLERTAQTLLSDLSHEMVRSLILIKGFADVLRGEVVGPLNDEQRRMLTTIGEEIERLSVYRSEILETYRKSHRAETENV